MTDEPTAHVRLKINLFHEVRNHDADVSEIEEKIKTHFNSGLHEMVEDVRIAVGYRAGAIFLVLSDNRFTYNDITSNRRIKYIIRRTPDMLERYNYAPNIKPANTRFDAVVR